MRRLWRALGIGALLGLLGPVTVKLHGPSPASTDASQVVERDAVARDAYESLRLLSQADTFLRLEKPELALRVIEGVEAVGPLAADLTRVRAWALFGSKRYGELGALLEDRHQGEEELTFLYGASLVRARLATDGSEVLKSLWWDRPDGVWGVMALGELGNIQGASPYEPSEREAIRRVIPWRETLSRQAKGVAAAQLVSSLEAVAPHGGRLRSELSYARGRALLSQEEFGDAITHFGRALSMANHPNLKRVIHLHLGEAHRRRGNYTSAMKHFDVAAGTQGDELSAQAHAHAGQMAIEHRRYGEARDRFQNQLVQNPVGPSRERALWGLGWVSMRTGEFVEARRFFSTLLAESPYGPMAPGAIYWGARAIEERGERERAHREMVSLLRRFPVDYYAYRARMSLEKRDWPAPASDLPGERGYPLDEIRAALEANTTRHARSLIKRAARQSMSRLGPVALAELSRTARDLDENRLGSAFERQRRRRFPFEDADDKRFLSESFPEFYTRLVRKYAKKSRVDPTLSLALVRQESGFRARVRSPVGALGLMQLMPATATELLREENKRARPSAEQILDPETNVRLGTRYFGRMLRSFRGNSAYALAAYNAGPGAVTRWRESRGELPEDIFVEEIPYRETRQYVRKVLGYARLLRFLEAPNLEEATEVAEATTKPSENSKAEQTAVAAKQ